MPAGQVIGYWEVVHDRIALRQEASTKAQMVGVLKKGELVGGFLTVENGQSWVQVSEETLKIHGFKTAFPDLRFAFGLIDGTSVGLGELLRKTNKKLNPPEPPAKAKPETTPKAVAKEVEKKSVKDFLETKSSKNPLAERKAVVPAETEDTENKEPSFVARPTGSRGEYIIAHTKVVERKLPTTKGDMVKVHAQGAIVEGVPHDVDGEPWLKLDKGWMLVDGVSVGLGMLLLPAADIAKDIVKWAEEQKSAPGGKKMTWTDATEDKLRSFETSAREQVKPLIPALEILAVLEVLESRDIITTTDFSLGADGLEKKLLRFLLRARAGSLLYGESAPPISEPDAFASMVKSVVHLMPFHSRTLAPDVDAQRLMVLFHGGAVRGDDLIEDAKLLRIAMPSMAIVLPEAPEVVDAENELRSWWKLAITGEESPDFKAMDDEQRMRWTVEHLTPPKEAILRAVNTIRAACKRFGNVPLIIGGFSQGSVLAAHSLEALRDQEITPQGLLILCGLMLPFKPVAVKCYAIHGYKDERVTIQQAQAVAQEMSNQPLKLDVIPGLGHEITDAVLDKSVAFCDQVAPVDDELAGKVRDQEARDSEMRQAKLLRWVKNFAQLAQMFDNPYFMSIIWDENMVRLGRKTGTIGSFPYYIHDAGPSSRGMVLLFHGKVGNLLEDTRPLAEAYVKGLRLSVCVVDYRPKFSTLGIDAQVTLESIEQISKNTSSPIIVHAVGIGAIVGIHVGMASQALPTVVQRRFRLLVLDAPVACMKALPPIPTGCIAVDPIGNDQKLKFVGMPICMLSGDDRCCGVKIGPKHWAAMSGALEVLKAEGKMADSVFVDDVALQAGSDGARLNGVLYKSALEALERQQRATDRNVADKFLQEIDMADAEEDQLAEKFEGKHKEVKALLEKILQACKSDKIENELWEVRAMAEPEKSEELGKLVASVLDPFLKATEHLERGAAGVKQLDVVVTRLNKDDPSFDLKEVQDEIRDALDTRRLDRTVAEVQRKYPKLGSVEPLHKILDNAAKFWQSEDCYNRVKAEVKAAANGTVTRNLINSVVTNIAAELNVQSAKELNSQASLEEANNEMQAAFGAYNQVDKALFKKGMRMQTFISAHVMQKIGDELGAVKTAALSNQVAPLPLAPPEWFDGAELDVVVYIDREFDLNIPLRATRGSKISDLKRLIAEADESGDTSAESVFLGFQGVGLSIHNDVLVTGKLASLDLLEEEVLPAGYVDLNREQAIGCLKELAEGFAGQKFQKALRDAKKKNGVESQEFVMARAHAVLDVQKTVVGKYGFKPNPRGVKDMMATMACYTGDPEQEMLNDYINKLLALT